MSDAMAQYTEAIRIDPKDARAHNNLGSLYLLQGDLERALSQCNRALAINPDFEEAEYNLGAVALRREDFPTATTHFERALELNPRFESARAALKSLRSTTGRENVRRDKFVESPRGD
jgi:tetratricopeptide (TPR) repeat protein